ncbi:MAG: helicase-related protein [Planctomycetes bacterium]|nr:helicase-related protein [Planctomycetota bacterium]
MKSSNFAGQRKFIREGFLDRSENLLIEMPTGSGKSRLAELMMEKTIVRGLRAAYVSPLRSILEERLASLEAKFPERSFAPLWRGAPKMARALDKDAQLFTNERFDLVLRDWRRNWLFIASLGLVVFDEIHLLEDDTRGARLEGTISRFRRLNPLARIVGLSGTLGDTSKLERWLDAKTFRDSRRPVPLEVKIERYFYPREKLDKLVRILGERKDEQTIVFVLSRKRAETLALKFSEIGHSCEFHHAGLGRNVREGVERAFRECTFRVLFATPTLDMGVNLPARNVVVFDDAIPRAGGWTHLSPRSVLQKLGRAGRPGLDSRGAGFVFAHNRNPFADSYLSGHVGAIESQLSAPSATLEQTLVEIACGLSTRTEELARTFHGSTLFGQTGAPGGFATIADELIRKSMIERKRNDPARLAPTKAGRAALRHGISPACFCAIDGLLRKLERPAIFDAFLVSALAADDFRWYRPEEHELATITRMLFAIRSELLDVPSSELRIPDTTGRDVVPALSSATLASSGPDGSFIFEEPYAGEWHRMFDVALAVAEASKLEPSKLRSLRAVFGAARMVVRKGKFLSDIGMVSGVGEKNAAKLAGAGVDSPEALALFDAKELSSAIGCSEKRARRLIENANALIKSDLWMPGKPAGADRVEIFFPESARRYRRSLWLDVATDNGAFVVSSGYGSHVVDATLGAGPENFELRCDCEDFADRGSQCKHVIAVERHLGFPRWKEFEESLAEAAKGLTLRERILHIFAEQ